MRRGSDWFALRLAGAMLSEIENHKVVRAKDWVDRDRGITAAHKIIARRANNGWHEDGRTEDDTFALGIAALANKLEAWRALGGASIWCSGHVPASASSVAKITNAAYRDFLLSTNGFVLRARFDKGGYRNEAVTTFLRADHSAVVDAYPSVARKGATIAQIDVIDPHLNTLDDFSGAVLQSDGRVTAWRDGKAAETHADFRAYFNAWLPRFDGLVLDTWGDVARR